MRYVIDVLRLFIPRGCNVLDPGIEIGAGTQVFNSLSGLFSYCMQRVRGGPLEK